MISLGDAQRHEGKDYDLAYNTLSRAHEYMKEYGDNIYRSRVLLYLGEVQIKRNKPLSSAQYFQEGLNVLSDTEIDDIKKDMHLGLAKALQLSGSFKESNDNLLKYAEINDSLFSSEKLKYMEEMQAKYESQKKETEIALLNAQKSESEKQLHRSKMGIYGMGIVLLILGIASFVYYRLFKKNKNLLSNLDHANNKILEQEKMIFIGRLAAGLGHEMNNPINYIHNNALALKMDTDELKPLLIVLEDYKNGKVKEGSLPTVLKNIDLTFIQKEIDTLIEAIKRGSTKVSEIVKNLKYISFDQSISKETKSPLLLIENALSTIEDSRSTMETLNLNISDVKAVQVYPSLFERCLANLIRNAEDATHPNNGKISINCYEKDDSTVFEIEDSGKGMTEEELNQVFQPFYTTKEVGKGLGLGLSICYGIVSSHGGEMEIESKIGKGTRVILMLPK